MSQLDKCTARVLSGWECESGTAFWLQLHYCQRVIAVNSEMRMCENHRIRRVYDENTEIWWFSVIDVVQVLTKQADYRTARNYWNKLT